jgi:hemoglobin
MKPTLTVLTTSYEHCSHSLMTDILQSTDTIFSAIGGEPAINHIVEAFYRRMETLPEARTIRAMHPPDLTSLKAVLSLYLGEWLGGPGHYSRQRGHPRLRMRHMNFRIGEAERDAWILCMAGALEEVVGDAALREHLLQKFFNLADWVRNDPACPHDAPQNR